MESSFLSPWGPRGLGIGLTAPCPLSFLKENELSLLLPAGILSLGATGEDTLPRRGGEKPTHRWRPPLQGGGCISETALGTSPARVAPRSPPLHLPAATGPLRASPRAAVPDQPERPLKFYAE